MYIYLKLLVTLCLLSILRFSLALLAYCLHLPANGSLRYASPFSKPPTHLEEG